MRIFIVDVSFYHTNLFRTSMPYIILTSSNGNIFRVTGPFVRGIHRWSVDSPHKGQWHRALMFSVICDWIRGWVNNCEAGDLRRHRAHYDVTVMYCWYLVITRSWFRYSTFTIYRYIKFMSSKLRITTIQLIQNHMSTDVPEAGVKCREK